MRSKGRLLGRGVRGRRRGLGGRWRGGRRSGCRDRLRGKSWILHLMMWLI